MIHENDRIDELLAGYALGALSAEDAEAADRLLTEHIPTCARCRETLSGFQAVAGDLGLAAAPRSPSELLAARVARDVAEERRIRRRRGPGTVIGVAAAATVAVFGLVTWNVVLQQRVSRAEGFQATMAEGFHMLSQPGSERISVTEDDGGPNLYLASLRGAGRMYLMGSGVPQPGEGRVYHVWGMRGADAELLAEFVPLDDGLVAVEIPWGLEPFDRLLIAVDPSDGPGRPHRVRWWTPVES
jgi:hypothetical protein